MSERIKLAVGIPTYDLKDMAGYPLQCLSRSERVEYRHHFEQSNSLLAMNNNMIWCQVLNMVKKGEITHYLQIHSDVRPRANVMPDWFDKMLDEMITARADVLSAIIPIKNNMGHTSTALDTERWNPQRLTQWQVNKQLPVTWTSDKLLFNTGLMLVDMRGSWTKDPPFFTIHDKIEQDEEGQWFPRCEPEDWHFARQCRERGMRCYVTRVVPVDHFGLAGWSSDGTWGHPIDPDCGRLSDDIQIVDAAGTSKIYNPRVKDFNNDTGTTNLPDGFFETEDIESYRGIYESLPEGAATAEVGVYRGRSLMSVADIIKRRHMQVFCVDTFRPYRKDTATDLYERFINLRANSGLIRHVSVLRGLSVEQSRNVRDGTLDFVFIDGSHDYQDVQSDILAWQPKLKRSGILAGHDYRSEPGVKRAVDEAFFSSKLETYRNIWLVRGVNS